MKQFIIRNLKVFISVIITALLFSAIGVYAGSQYLAKNIGFTPSSEDFKKANGEPIDNIEDAINVLYQKNSSGKAILGYPTSSGDASWCVGKHAVYMPDKNYEGYGPSNTNGWGTPDNVVNVWNAFNYSEKVRITHVRIAYGVADDTTWIKEGDVTIQASNDNFTNEIVEFKKVHLSFDEELLKIGKYGIFWEGDIENENEYYSYRIIAKDSSGFTGKTKLQLTYIRYS